MQDKPSVVERAFQVAKSGAVANISELSAQLTAEGYVNCAPLLSRRAISIQITRMIAEARQPPTL